MGQVYQGVPLFPSVNEFDLLNKIMNLLGDPNTKTWKNITKMPNFGKLSFKKVPAKKLENVFSEAEQIDIEFLKKVKWEYV